MAKGHDEMVLHLAICLIIGVHFSSGRNAFFFAIFHLNGTYFRTFVLLMIVQSQTETYMYLS